MQITFAHTLSTYVLENPFAQINSYAKSCSEAGLILEKLCRTQKTNTNLANFLGGVAPLTFCKVKAFHRIILSYIHILMHVRSIHLLSPGNLDEYLLTHTCLHVSYVEICALNNLRFKQLFYISPESEFGTHSTSRGKFRPIAPSAGIHFACRVLFGTAPRECAAAFCLPVSLSYCVHRFKRRKSNGELCQCEKEEERNCLEIWPRLRHASSLFTASSHFHLSSDLPSLTGDFHQSHSSQIFSGTKDV